MNILGVSCHYHESAAALVRDGKIVAAIAEERLSRKKHDAGFPARAIDFCMQYGRPDYVVFYEKPLIKFARNLETSVREFPKSMGYFVESMSRAFAEKLWIQAALADYCKVPADKILFVPHHASHAAAAFYPSPFHEAAILTLDGIGEWTTGTLGVGRGNSMTIHSEMQYPHSVGLLYSVFTAYLGFEVNDGEYKVMGMAGYGKPRHVDKVKKLYHQYADGSVRLNLDYFSFQYSTRRMYSNKFKELFAGADRFDVAASIQKVTEEIVLTIAKYLHKKTRLSNLVYAGGVALNSVVNAKLLLRSGFRNVFIFPAAGDDGGSVGAALFAYHQLLGYKKRHKLPDVFLGNEYDAGKFIRSKKLRFRRLNMAYIIDQLVTGKVVGWYEGRSEFGPRALGHRSILADPVDPKMKDIVNRKIKFREEFRPFAPMVLTRYAKKYFPDSDINMSPFMLATWQASPQAKKIAPATTHVDGTSRIQITDHPVLRAFYKKTGRPILMNTSFNLKGEPIVETPGDAYDTFMRSGLDILVMGKYVIVK